MLKKKVTDQLAIFDSNHYCESIKPDQVLKKSFYVNSDGPLTKTIE